MSKNEVKWEAGRVKFEIQETGMGKQARERRKREVEAGREERQKERADGWRAVSLLILWTSDL